MAKAVRILVGLEALAVAALSVLLMVLMIIKRPSNLPAAIFEVVFALVVAATLWVASRGPKLRAAAILLNIMALPISRTLLQGERNWIAIPVALLALASLTALFLDRKSLA